MFGASGGRRRCCARGLYTDSCMVRPAMLPDGVGGNGRVSPPGIGVARNCWFIPGSLPRPTRFQCTSGSVPRRHPHRVKTALRSRTENAPEADVARRGLLGLALPGRGR